MLLFTFKEKLDNIIKHSAKLFKKSPRYKLAPPGLKRVLSEMFIRAEMVAYLSGSVSSFVVGQKNRHTCFEWL